MFKESLHRLSDSSWLAITLDASQDHEPPTRNLKLAYATLHMTSDSKRDLLELLSLPVEADPKAAKDAEQIAVGQRNMADQTAGTKSEVRYRKSERNYAVKAQALRKPTRRLPQSVHVVGWMRVLCVYWVHQRPSCFRLIDIDSDQVLWSINGAGILAQIAAPGGATKSSTAATRLIGKLLGGMGKGHLSESSQRPSEQLDELARMFHKPTTAAADHPAVARSAPVCQLNVEQTTPSLPNSPRTAPRRALDGLATHVHEASELAKLQKELLASGNAPRKLRLLSSSEDRMLLDSGFEKILASCQNGKFQALARWPSYYGSWPVAARTAGGFIFQRDIDKNDRHELLHVRANDGAVLDLWPSKGRQTLCSAADATPPADSVAFAALGGQVLLHQTGLERPLTVPKLLGLDNYDPLDLALAPGAALIAMSRGYDASTLALYDRDRALATQICLPATEILEVDGERQVRSPGFSLTEQSVWVLAAGQLSETPLAALDWQAPSPPAPPIKRRKTPALTLEAALKHEPLASIADQIRSWFRPGVVLAARPVRDHRCPVGGSKAGGHPDLPPGTPWPRCQGQPMAFMLQINLADIAVVDATVGLPAEGLLSVFLAFDDTQMPSFYSDANSSPEGCRVIYTASTATLHRTPPPVDMPNETGDGKSVVSTYTARHGGPMLPELSNDRVQRAQLTPAQANAYRDLVTAVNGDDESLQHWATRLGGYPAVLQNDDFHLQAETHARSRPLDDNTYAQWTDPTFQQSAQAWRQLLQLAEGKEGWTWGDAGLMHVMVREDNWTDGEFTLAWGIGVCH